MKNRIRTMIEAENKGAVRFHERCGFSALPYLWLKNKTINQ